MVQKTKAGVTLFLLVSDVRLSIIASESGTSNGYTT